MASCTSDLKQSPQSLLSRLGELLAQSPTLEDSRFAAHGVDYAAQVEEMRKVSP